MGVLACWLCASQDTKQWLLKLFLGFFFLSPALGSSKKSRSLAHGIYGSLLVAAPMSR